jgi:membrane protein DedA with SNARE-associated domain
MTTELISLQTIQDFAEHYGYWTVLLGIMLENAGLPLPGETIVVVCGFLAGGGQMNYGWVLLCAIAGAIIGDNLGYWVGYHGGWPLLLNVGKILRMPETKLLDLRHRFSHNAARAVFLGRFIALLRIFAGPMAGIAQMPYGKFLIYNSAGAALWASVTITIAFFAGRVIPLERLVGLMGQLGVGIFGIAVLWLGLPPLIKYLRHRPKPLLQTAAKTAVQAAAATVTPLDSLDTPIVAAAAQEVKS